MGGASSVNVGCDDPVIKVSAHADKILKLTVYFIKY